MKIEKEQVFFFFHLNENCLILGVFKNYEWKVQERENLIQSTQELFKIKLVEMFPSFKDFRILQNMVFKFYFTIVVQSMYFSPFYLVSHTGCVNTIIWNDTGDKLISGSDDLKVIF